jgi:hypothetical protein
MHEWFSENDKWKLFCTQIISVCPIDIEKKSAVELISEINSEFEFRMILTMNFFDGNKRDIIWAFNGYSPGHLPNLDEEIDMDHHWQIENRWLVAMRNQR